jgi:hypothetical protein
MSDTAILLVVAAVSFGALIAFITAVFWFLGKVFDGR